MYLTAIGQTGLQLSRLGLGTMGIGSMISESESYLLMDSALELGINLFETANVYGWHHGESLAEQIIGRWLAQGSSRRERVILAVKVDDEIVAQSTPGESWARARRIRQACEKSLQRLRTDHIDIFQLHQMDPHTSWEETWQVLEELMREGKILHVGSSNFAGQHIVQANGTTEDGHFSKLVTESVPYNLTARAAEQDIIPTCRDFEMGILCCRPLAGGLLAGPSQHPGIGQRSSEWIQRESKQHHLQLEAHTRLCQSQGKTPAGIALAWLLHNPDVTSLIIGPRTQKQLQDCVRALDIVLTEEILTQLDSIWPGPQSTRTETLR